MLHAVFGPANENWRAVAAVGLTPFCSQCDAERTRRIRLGKSQTHFGLQVPVRVGGGASGDLSCHSQPVRSAESGKQKNRMHRGVDDHPARERITMLSA